MNSPTRSSVLAVSLAAICLCIFASGCSSGGGRLYVPESNPPALKDGLISMKTRWSAHEDAPWDERRLRCSQGVITATLIKAEGGRWEDTISTDEWQRLWNQLLAKQPFGQYPPELESNDPQAEGPYHLIALKLGEDSHVFSAQLRANVFGVMTTSSVRDRMMLSEAIANAVGRLAVTEVEAPPESERNSRLNRSPK